MRSRLSLQGWEADVIGSLDIPSSKYAGSVHDSFEGYINFAAQITHRMHKQGGLEGI